MFLNPVGSVGHIVHSSASGQEISTHYFSLLGGPSVVFIKNAFGHVTPNMCFCIRLDPRVTYGVLVRLGHEMLMHYFSYSGGSDTDSTKKHRDTLHRSCVFASSGIYG
jgi:hypothetical protein